MRSNEVSELADTDAHVAVKIVGAKGQISHGKQFAGLQVLVEERESGCWLIRAAQAIPDKERWLFEPKAAQDLTAALEWAMQNPPIDRNADEILKALRDAD